MKNQSSITIYPTDTVWGIGASIYDQEAYNEIARIKQTSGDKPLSVMFTDINQLMESFSFPKVMDKNWLLRFFEMESTLGLPLNLAKIKIPFWVHGKSDMISLRFSTNELLKTIPSPFFTTSLNLTGELPITTIADAIAFQKKYAPDVQIITGPDQNLSGESSTIVFFKDNTFQVIRKGRHIDMIKKHLELTGFTCR